MYIVNSVSNLSKNILFMNILQELVSEYLDMLLEGDGEIRLHILKTHIHVFFI